MYGRGWVTQPLLPGTRCLQYRSTAGGRVPIFRYPHFDSTRRLHGILHQPISGTPGHL